MFNKYFLTIPCPFHLGRPVLPLPPAPLQPVGHGQLPVVIHVAATAPVTGNQAPALQAPVPAPAPAAGNPAPPAPAAGNPAPPAPTGTRRQNVRAGGRARQAAIQDARCTAAAAAGNRRDVVNIDVAETTSMHRHRNIDNIDALDSIQSLISNSMDMLSSAIGRARQPDGGPNISSESANDVELDRLVKRRKQFSDIGLPTMNIDSLILSFQAAEDARLNALLIAQAS